MNIATEMKTHSNSNFTASRLLKIFWSLSLLLLMTACGGNDNADRQGDLAEGMASLTVSIPGLNANRAGQKSGVVDQQMAQRAGVPAEVTSLLIEVLNGNNVLLDAAEVIGTEGTVILNVPAGENYSLRGSAFAGTELLFLGEAALQSLQAGTNSTVNLTLADQIQLSLTSPGDIEIGIGTTSINFNLSGLNNTAINWLVNNLAGGSTEFGLIDATGRYTPPASLPANPLITITAEPVVSPSFAESFSFNLLPPNNVNNDPVADAGIDQSVLEQTSVTLDGSASNDTDGSISAYSWQQTAGITVSLSSTTTVAPGFTAPTVTATTLLVFELTVTDNEAATDTDSVTITVQAFANIHPVADAGSDQTVTEQTLVSLNGTASSDSDGSIDSYSWLQTSGTSVTLSSATAVSPSFTAPSVTANTQLTFELTVTDNQGATHADNVTISVQALPNVTPVADAGADQTVNVGDNVILSGVASNDPDGTIVSYLWTLNSEDLFPVLINGNTATASFIAPPTQYGGGAHYSLTVTDNDGATDFDDVSIIVNGSNQPLVADAGSDQVVTENTVVTLDSSGSNDPDNAITAYFWEELTNGGIVLSANSAQMPTFTAPDVTQATNFQFRLTVTNNHADQAQDSVNITVNDTVALASKVYFAATNTNTFNYNLWATDGTEAGTQQVAVVGMTNYDIRDFKTIGDHFYFEGFDSVNGRELWRTDGTAAGTEILPSADDSAYLISGARANADPSAFSVLGDRLLYRATTSQNSSGTNFPEYLSLEDRNKKLRVLSVSGISSSNNNHVGVLNGFSYYFEKVTTPKVSTLLYKTDGFNPATLVETIDGFDNLEGFTQVETVMFFIKRKELWRTDGTGAGTFLVKTFTNHFGSIDMIAFDKHLFFNADDGQGGELWKSDGTTAGTILVKDLDGTTASSNPGHFNILNGRLLFLSSGGGVASDGLWVSNGTTAGTQLAASLSVGLDIGWYEARDSGLSVVVESLNLMFFTANDGVTGVELWATDGNSAQLVMDINSGSLASNPGLFRPAEGFLIFIAEDGDGRAKLWRTDGTEAGTSIVKDIFPKGSLGSSMFFQPPA